MKDGKMDVLIIGFQLLFHTQLTKPRHFRLKDTPDITPNSKSITHAADGLQ